MSGYKQLPEKIGFLWSLGSAVISPGALTWLLADLFVSGTLRRFAIGASIIASLLGFLLAASGIEHWAVQQRRMLAIRSVIVFVLAGLGCAFLLTALRADVATQFPLLRETGRFLVLATPFSNFLIAALWGLALGALVFALVALSPNLPTA